MSDMVQCATCKTMVPSSQADIVTFGTGYQCQRCNVGTQVVAHHQESQRNWERSERDQTIRLMLRLIPVAIIALVALVGAALKTCSHLLQ